MGSGQLGRESCVCDWPWARPPAQARRPGGHGRECSLLAALSLPFWAHSGNCPSRGFMSDCRVGAVLLLSERLCFSPSILSHQVAVCVGRDTVRLGWTLCSLDPLDSWFVGLSGGAVTPSAVCWAQATAPWRELGCTRRGSVPRVATLPVPARGGLDECLAVW